MTGGMKLVVIGYVLNFLHMHLGSSGAKVPWKRMKFAGHYF